MRAQAWHDLFDTCIFEIKQEGERRWAGGPLARPGLLVGWTAGCAAGRCCGSTGTERQRRLRESCVRPQLAAPHPSAHLPTFADVPRFKEELLRLANQLLA